MLELDKTTFEAEVLQAPGKILVDFYGDGHLSEDPRPARHRDL